MSQTKNSTRDAHFHHLRRRGSWLGMKMMLYHYLFLLRNLISVPLWICIIPSVLHGARGEEVVENPLLFCESGANFTNRSQFEMNLINHLLPSLAANGPLYIDSFYNTSYGSDPDRVYGLSQCMSGASVEDCRVCLNNSLAAILRNCANRREAAVRYYNCILRYSDWQFFSYVEKNRREGLYNVQNISDPARFDQVVRVLMENVTSAAASVPSRIAAGVINYTGFARIYGFAQCTRDLSAASCDRCLKGAVGLEINWCCYGKQGGNVYFVSCNIRYDTYPFYPATKNTTLVSLSLSRTASGDSLSPSPSASGDSKTTGKRKKGHIKVVIIIVVGGCLLIMCMSLNVYNYLHRKKKSHEEVPLETNQAALLYDTSIPMTSLSDNNEGRISINPQDLSFLDLDTILAATSNFSNQNKLGEGGFGPVYKGTLPDGSEIAVKKLSKSSGQGLQEFKNEILLIAKLQHRNLVRLLHCCMEKRERLLIYEYMPNKSLDVFLFDETKRSQLDWQMRYNIVLGIARGILYLHEDSRLKVVHRDLKASNILLDSEMNPKISDFGMARIFGGKQHQANTNRVVGTFGYMAPEYAMHGVFSVKSDVFSFGVLLLEIIAGRRNSRFNMIEQAQSLLTYAWQLWSNNLGLELIDPLIIDSCIVTIALRCIQIGLLCVQEDADDRPTISLVTLMIGSEDVALPNPKKPAFYTGKVFSKRDSQASPKSISMNYVTNSDVVPR